MKRNTCWIFMKYNLKHNFLNDSYMPYMFQKKSKPYKTYKAIEEF